MQNDDALTFNDYSTKLIKSEHHLSLLPFVERNELHHRDVSLKLHQLAILISS